MSVSRSYQTDLKDQGLLVRALERMGMKPTVQNPAAIRGDRYETSSQKCDVVLKREDNNRKADIGFAKTKLGTYEVVTDTYVNRDLNLEKFSVQVKQQYTAAQARQLAKKAGLAIIGEKVVNGEIKMQFSVPANA